MPFDLIVRGASVVMPDGVAVRDVGVQDGRIAAVETVLTEGAPRELDAAGLHLFPGVIDAHVHFNEPGRADWEGVATGSTAMAAGGGTLFADMPLNASPPTLDAAAFRLKEAACRASSRTDFALWGGLTPVNLAQMSELAACGVVGFKAFFCHSGIDDFPFSDAGTLREGMARAADLGLPVAVHAESHEKTAALTAAARAAGRRGVADFLATRPPAVELEAIDAVIALARETGCDTHIVHVSLAAGIERIRAAARAGGVRITCETCPHYLLFSEADLLRRGAPLKCAPPLRPEAERAALCRLVAAGEVDLIGSDHSPSPPAMKDRADFFDVWGGIAGVQTTLRALLTLEPAVPLPRIAELLAGRVADRFRLAGKGRLAPGCDADFTLVDLRESPVLSREELRDRHRANPLAGRMLRGQIAGAWLRGHPILLDGEDPVRPAPRLVRPAA